MPQPETTKQGMRKDVEHLQLTTEHPVHGKRTNYLYEGTSLTIGRKTAEELGKLGRDHIFLNDPEKVVSRDHGEVSFNNGRISYKDSSTNGTKIIDADGNLLREIKNERVEIEPSQRLLFPNGSTISFDVGRVEVKVSEPEQVRVPQAKETKLDHMLSTAGTRRPELVVSLIDNLAKRREEEIGKIGFLATLPKEGKAIIVGDIHSRPDCLEHILRETDFVGRVEKGEKLYLVFLGDFVDRPRKAGDGGVFKVLETVLALKNQFWDNVVIIPGNHDIAKEGEVIPQEFMQEARMKYGNEMGQIIAEKYRGFFEKMPIAVKMENGAIASHAGASSTVKSLLDLKKPSEETRFQMTWNDPRDVIGYLINTDRKFDELSYPKAFIYGENELNFFLNTVGSRVMIRAHEQKVQHEFNGKCLTLNSTDYKNAQKAYAVVDLSKEIHNTNQIELHYF